MPKTKKRRRSRTARAKPVQDQPGSDVPHGWTRVRPFRKPEVIIYGALASPPILLWFGLDSIDAQIGLQGSSLWIARAYVLGSVFTIWMVYDAARTFVSTERVWLFFLLALNQIVIGGAVVYRMLSSDLPTSFELASGATGLSRIEALYLSVTTFTSTSYGDVLPVTEAARTLCLAQGILAFLLLLSLGYVLIRSTSSLGSARNHASRESALPLQGRVPLALTDRVLTLGPAVPWIVLWGIAEPGRSRLADWQVMLMALALCVPFAVSIRILRAIRNAGDMQNRGKRLFVDALWSMLLGGSFCYWSLSQSNGAFVTVGGGALSIVDSVGFALGNLTTVEFNGVSPASDVARIFIVIQQAGSMTLFAVVLVYLNARWRPADQIARVRESAAGLTIRPHIPGDARHDVIAEVQTRARRAVLRGLSWIARVRGGGRAARP